jgi:hypothetical protein
MKLRKERGGQKAINDFALGGEGREKGRGTRDDCNLKERWKKKKNKNST